MVMLPFWLLFSCVQLSVTPWAAACQASPISLRLVKLISTESMMKSNHLILCRPLLLLTSFFINVRIFFSESALHIRWRNYWRFSFSLTPSNEYSGLISFRKDWFDLFDVQSTLKSLLQHHSLKASIFWLSVFSQLVQLSHSYMTTG